MKTAHTITSNKTDSSNHSYAYYELKEKLINGSDFYELIQEVREKYKATGNKELISYDDVSKYLKEDLLPFIESIFNFNLFDAYMNSSRIQESSICDTIRVEFVNFINIESNTIVIALNEFKNGHEDLYEAYSDLENSLVRRIFQFVFQNTRFTGGEKKFILNADSNQFIKEYLNTVLVATREKPNAIHFGLLEAEVNRVQTLILKNANFNFLNWYLIELKSALTDLKFIHKSQPNYGLKCSELALRKLYRKLKSEDFIDIDHTTEDNFVEVFLKDWYTHDSICVLKMDNPQTKCFLDQFKVHLNSKLLLSHIEKVKNIANKNGYISSASLSASSSRNKLMGPDHEQYLSNIFKAIKG